MPKLTVLYLNNSPDQLLLVEDLTVKEGVLKAWVVNGDWRLQIKDGKGTARVAKHSMTQFAVDSIELIEVPKEKTLRDYNSVLNWAREQIANSRPLILNSEIP